MLFKLAAALLPLYIWKPIVFLFSILHNFFIWKKNLLLAVHDIMRRFRIKWISNHACVQRCQCNSGVVYIMSRNREAIFYQHSTARKIVQQVSVNVCRKIPLSLLNGSLQITYCFINNCTGFYWVWDLHKKLRYKTKHS